MILMGALSPSLSACTKKASNQGTFVTQGAYIAVLQRKDRIQSDIDTTLFKDYELAP